MYLSQKTHPENKHLLVQLSSDIIHLANQQRQTNQACGGSYKTQSKRQQRQWLHTNLSRRFGLLHFEKNAKKSKPPKI